eukprot:g2523.t1
MTEIKNFTFQPIGILSSCFPDCRGTPRQGTMTPLTRARLTLRKDIQPYAFDSLQEYSHVWVFFVFHANKNGKPFSKVKIKPPKHTSKVGVFSTRSPHRPNPIGQSLCMVDKIEGSTLFLSGIDLLDGTPVLDIKPYVPFYDCIEARCAPWVENAFNAPKIDVTFSPLATAQLENYFIAKEKLKIAKKEKKEKRKSRKEGTFTFQNDPNIKEFQDLKLSDENKNKVKEMLVELDDSINYMKNANNVFTFYDSVEEVKQVLTQLLSQDIRSGGARSKRLKRGDAVDEEGAMFCVSFDGADIKVKVVRSSVETNENGEKIISSAVNVEKLVPTRKTREGVNF